MSCQQRIAGSQGCPSTAFGLYGLITGAAVLAGSVIAGWLWTDFGPATTFLPGAVLGALALTGIAIRRSRESVL